VDRLYLVWLSFILFCFGLLFGSFLNVVGYRLPRGESIAFPPSHCPSCKTRLRYFELVPVLSWIVLRGECRTCRTNISIRYPLIETITGVLFALTALQGLPWLKLCAWCFFWMVLVGAMACDMTSMRIPNALSYMGGMFVFFFAGLSHVHTFGFAFLGGIVCFFALLLIHILSGGRMGLGDAKLYFSIGVMLGPAYGLLSLAFASAFGSFIGIAMRLCRLIGKKAMVPFVPYICMGVVVAVYFGPAFIQWYSNLLL
jgi:prepilin signal peptidase PulO-like enzyme (type II secretory pathway)